MTQTQHNDLDLLRRREVELSAENARLNGATPTNRGQVELIEENHRLRRRVEQLRSRLPAPAMGMTADGAFLTIHQIASRLNTTAARAADLLDRVPTRIDDNGQQIVSADCFEQFILDSADGRDPSRFL